MYGTYENYQDYIRQFIRAELETERAKSILKDIAINLALFITTFGIQILNDIIVLSTKMYALEFNYMKIIELTTKILALCKLVHTVYKNMYKRNNPQRAPNVHTIIMYPQRYINSNIPANAIMDPNEYVRGIAMLAQAIENANSANLRSLVNLEERMNTRMDNLEERMNTRMDNIEERMNTRMDNLEERMNTRIDEGFARIVALLEQKK